VPEGQMWLSSRAKAYSVTVVRWMDSVAQKIDDSLGACVCAQARVGKQPVEEGSQRAFGAYARHTRREPNLRQVMRRAARRPNEACTLQGITWPVRMPSPGCEPAMATCLCLTVDIQACGCCDGGCETTLAMLRAGSSTVPAAVTPCARRSLQPKLRDCALD
jgi:hypothetical protein